MRARGLLLFVVASLGCPFPAGADVLPRPAVADGSVIARKSGEEVRFIDVSGWRFVDVKQDLLAGDALRTNAQGALAVLFADHTQIRMARNTTLLVKEVGSTSDSRFALEGGTIWARAQRGGIGLTIDTPAAAAAIRGTDWTMTVDATGKTSLVVLEGEVELFNPQGSVTVRRGEGAVARIGQAPTKIIIVDPDDREQMLFYYSLKGVFSALPASPLPAPRMRAERLRIGAIPASRRTAEDWVTLAEASLSFDGRAAAASALQEAGRHRLTATQRARLDLIEALIAGAGQRHADAARLFQRALPGLDRNRRAIAAYGGYFARALVDPDRAEKPPAVKDAGPYAAIAEAMTAGFLTDIKTAVAILRRAEARYPSDPTLPAVRARFAMLLDDREQVREAIARSLALDPDDFNALLARATYRADLESDFEGALADLERARAIAPGESELWNTTGLVESARGAQKEAEKAFRRAIALDPESPVARANMAILFLDQGRVREAGVEIDKALALDPGFDIALVARGRYHLQKGEMAQAVEDLLAGSTANPAYSQGLLLLGAAYYENGDGQAAAQALDNADRLDPNDSVTSAARTAIAIDAYEADAAISAAQEGLRRARARGGAFESLSANRDAGSTLNSAFRLLGLNEWGRFYGDIVFDPFTASGYVDQAVAGSVNPFVTDLTAGRFPSDPTDNANTFSSLLQGLMLDPGMVSARQRSANLLRRPFVEGSLSGGPDRESGGRLGWHGDAEIQSYSVTPVPWSFYGAISNRDGPGLRDTGPSFTAVGVDSAGIDSRRLSATAYLTAQPTPADRLVAFGSFVDSDARYSAIPGPAFAIPPGAPLPFTGIDFSDRGERQGFTGGLAWSHSFGYRNVGSAGVFGTSIRERSTYSQVFEGGGAEFGARTAEEIDQRYAIGALNHAVGIGDLTLRYGLEGGTLNLGQTDTLTLFSPTSPPIVASSAGETGVAVGRAYLDGIYEFSHTLKAEAALFGTRMDGGALEVKRLEPRLAAAWSPMDGHWLRAGFLRETALIDATTLAPVGVLGLQSNQLPLSPGGYSDTFAARWDAQWSDRVFTAVDYQHQKAHDLAVPQPFQLATIAIPEGRIDRVSATANVWIGGGFGAFATFAYADSDGGGLPLPFVPEKSARFGLTFVHPSNIKVTLSQSYVGERTGDAVGTVLDGYWTTDAALTWESPDKRLVLDLAGYNLTNTKFEVAPDMGGWGPSFFGTLKVRF